MDFDTFIPFVVAQQRLSGVLLATLMPNCEVYLDGGSAYLTSVVHYASMLV